MISFDLQIMLAIATCVRVYWSLSPPPIWSDEPEWIQWISKGDLFFSVFVWGACCLLSKDKFWTGLFGEKAVKRDSFDMDMGMGNDGGMEMRGMSIDIKSRIFSWDVSGTLSFHLISVNLFR